MLEKLILVVAFFFEIDVRSLHDAVYNALNALFESMSWRLF